MNLGHWELADGVTLPEDFEENPPMGFVYKIENKETNLKKYYFGNQDITLNYLEIKAAADWLLYKIIQIQLRDSSSDNITPNKSLTICNHKI